MDTLLSVVVRRSFLPACALSLLAIAAPLHAADPPVDSPAMNAFITEVADPVGSGKGLARMEAAACVRVHNADAEMADYLQHRMATTAALTGMQVRQAACVPNVDVVFTEDANAMAAQLLRERPQLFYPFGRVAGTTQGAQALGEFVRSATPVRWWQTTVPVEASGEVALDLPQADATLGVRGSGTHLTQAVRDRLLGTLVLVDVGKLGETTWDQLADYLAMVTLAQVNPHAQVAAYESILNLFTGEQAPPALTAMDRAYLQSLYRLNRHLYPHAQHNQLAASMLRSLQQPLVTAQVHSNQRQ